MNTTIISLFALLATVAPAAVNEAAPPPCCPVPAAPPAGCAPEKTADAKGAAAPCCEELKPAAPLTARSLYQLEAKFTDDAGRPATLASWRGRPVVLAMFFASCEYACPVLVEDLRRRPQASLSNARHIQASNRS